MKLVDVHWTSMVNLLEILCCGHYFKAWSNFSLVKCPYCGAVEYWHDFYPKKDNDYAVMENCIRK